jgi:hypothetical protein
LSRLSVQSEQTFDCLRLLLLLCSALLCRRLPRRWICATGIICLRDTWIQSCPRLWAERARYETVEGLVGVPIAVFQCLAGILYWEAHLHQPGGATLLLRLWELCPTTRCRGSRRRSARHSRPTLRPSRFGHIWRHCRESLARSSCWRSPGLLLLCCPRVPDLAATVDDSRAACLWQRRHSLGTPRLRAEQKSTMHVGTYGIAEAGARTQARELSQREQQSM